MAVFGVFPLTARPQTEGAVTVTCPIGGQTSAARIDMCGTVLGQRLDLRPLGPIAAPWRLPVCPDNHFVVYKQELFPAEIDALTAFVGSPQYRAWAAEHTPRYLVARMREHLCDSPQSIVFAYLEASWEVEANRREETVLEYLWLALEQLVVVIATMERGSQKWLNANMLAGKFERFLRS